MDKQDWIVVLVLSVMLAIGAGIALYGLIIVVSDAAAPCEAPDAGWQPPDLSLCPEGIGLWDCIRNASYRSDI